MKLSLDPIVKSYICNDRKKALGMKDLIPHKGYPIFEETSLYMIEMCHRYKPERILDTGAGWTSVLLRKFWPHAEIVSVEMEQLWLDRAAELIRRFQMDGIGQLHLWSDFLKQIHPWFDFISHDLGNMAIRQETLATVVSFLDPKGIMFLDNFGVSGYKEFAGAYLMSHRFKPVYPKNPMAMDVSYAGRFAVYARGYE